MGGRGAGEGGGVKQMMIPEALLKDAFYLQRLEKVPGLPDHLSVEQFGKLYAALYPAEQDEAGPDHKITWVWDLMDHLSQNAPRIALECIACAARQPLSRFQASCLAAGPLEDIIADHGPDVIERIEALAKDSARFRYLLSGVWPRGQDTAGDIWHRVLRARAPGPDMDQGAAVSAADL